MTYKIEFKFTDCNMKLPTTHICENYSVGEYFVMLENEFGNKIYIHTSEIDYFTVTKNIEINYPNE